jgi:hypothetical protein
VKHFSLISLVILLLISAAPADVVHLQVSTDQDKYLVGQTVNWTVYVWAEPGVNRGIAYINFDLKDDTFETLSPALKTGPEFTDTDFGTAQKFTDPKPGTWDPNTLHDIIAYQYPFDRLLDVANSGVPNVLCKGSYTANVLGFHTLSLPDVRVDYWTGPTGGAVRFETIDPNSVVFKVIDEPEVCGDPGTAYLKADLNRNCYVDFLDYHILASQFGNPCTGPSWCLRADINTDQIVNLVDVFLFTTQWLYCTDPENAICDPYW